MKLSVLLVLVASALLLSGASGKDKNSDPLLAPPKAKNYKTSTPKHIDEGTRKNRATEPAPLLQTESPSQIEQHPIIKITPQPTQTSTGVKKNAPPKHGPQSIAFSVREWSDPIVLIGFAALLVTVVYTFAAISQWSAIKSQAEIAKETLKFQDKSLTLLERAWLSVTFDSPLDPKEIGSKGIEFTIRNHGHSVAFIKEDKLRGMSWEGKSNMPDRRLDPKPTGQLATKFILFPNQSMITQGPLGFKLTTDMINGGCIFDVYGYVAYDDIFGVRHITRFCQVYNYLTRGFDFPREAKPEYNDAD